ncbi:nucleobase:cation symporter-2 family protein [Paramicrobacterium agarici]|uniref:NCS2 family nucleobase:cation symporter-2 n=1 Tax=Paramicrobacterium agarici TaxID=630514 RepID=A0A2A9DVJ6_9MICO|nr:nucleobase:cation symporter-2 family protein [Microbacterium agarici]PFG30708.1 NCS2 family nucleobase:cation symporter-2 [Microbacterium agarici]
MSRAQRVKTPIDPERPEDERMPVGSAFAYGLQHVLTMYGGIIAVPIIIGGAAGLGSGEIAILLASCLFIGGLATLLQTVGIPFFGSKLPLVQGVSFAAVATMLSILNQGSGIQAVFGAVLVASIIGLVIAPFFARIVRLFPPIVTGIIITTIGLTLIPVAAGWIVGNNPDAVDYADPSNIALAGITLAIIMLLSKVGNATISRLSILIALVLGTGVGALMGKVNFSGVFDGPYVSFPNPFHFGLPQFEPAAIFSMVIVILVIMTETTADLIAIAEITGSKMDSKRIAAGLRADMLSSAVSPVFNSFTQSAFAQNVGLVAVTKIKSRWAVAAGGVIMVVLGLLPVLGRLVAAIPMPVLGGAGIVLFGTVTASGIRTLSKVNYRDNMNLIIVATAITFGVLPVVNHDIYSNFPSWFQVIFDSGISSAAVMAVLLNLLFNEFRFGTPKDPSVFAAAPTRQIPIQVIECLQEGDRCVDGKIVDADDNEVVLVDSEGNEIDVPGSDATDSSEPPKNSPAS